ncbi:hypothetical protein FHY55_05585 [Oceanicola sp. D3]|uniref:hypothetical protein n=1 Tax=Oceanicola sp. D3 TaxID=2587163 RepID=UPI0011228F81|nr:hypothetical protein [Oceanicola sp. D3]QDC08741.1 hypothetical protein FHY55_05585 [Oceanicola sp. D3]
MPDSAVAGCIQNIVAPVIFIPGIMGSRLRNQDGDIVWNPGVDTWEQIGNAFGLARRFAAGKRRRIVGSPDQYFRRDHASPSASRPAVRARRLAWPPTETALRCLSGCATGLRAGGRTNSGRFRN